MAASSVGLARSVGWLEAIAAWIPRPLIYRPSPPGQFRQVSDLFRPSDYFVPSRPERCRAGSPCDPCRLYSARGCESNPAGPVGRAAAAKGEPGSAPEASGRWRCAGARTHGWYPSGIFFFAMGHLLTDDRRMSPIVPGLCENTLPIIAQGKDSRKLLPIRPPPGLGVPCWPASMSSRALL